MPEFLVPFIVAAASAVSVAGGGAAITTATAVVTIGTVTITAGMLATAAASIIIGVVAVGIGLLIAPKPPEPDNQRFAIQQAIPPRTFGYGFVRFAGYVAFLEQAGSSLFQVCSCFGHQCAGVIRIFLNDDEVTVSIPWPFSLNSGLVLGLSDGRYQQCITLDYRVGLPTETAYSFMVSSFPGIWGNDHRGDNVASAFISAIGVPAANFGKTYPYARPQLSFVWKTALVYDPRIADAPPTPVTFGSSSGSASAVTITIATATFTISGSAPATGSPVVFSTTGALPTPLSPGVAYYVVAPSGSSFLVALTLGGAPIGLSGTQSGTHTATFSIAGGALTIAGAAPRAGTACVLATTGTLPTGLSPGVTYYVLSPSGSTFQLALAGTEGVPGYGAVPIQITGTGSGTHTATLGQTFANQQSWPFSQNAALCILHFQCFSPYGPLLPYARAIAPVVAQWIAAANCCDEAVPLKAGGTEPRYQLGGMGTTEQDPRAILQTMLQACDGWYVQRGDGTTILIPGFYADFPAAITITDDDIVGFDLQTDLPDETKVNSVTASWTSPSNGYTTVETDPLDDTADQVARGHKRQARLELTWVQSNGQASRLRKREFIRQKAQARGTLLLRLSAINAFYERWIVVNSKTIPRLHNMVIENRKTVISLSQPTAMDFIQTGAEVDVYDPAVDESAPPTVATRPTTVGLPIPSNVAAVAQQITSGGVTTIFLAVSWDQPINTLTGSLRTDVTYIVQWQLTTGAAGWISQTYAPGAYAISAGRITANTAPVPANTSVQVQVAATGVGARTAFSAPITTSTAASSTAPGPPTSLTAVGGAGSAALSCHAPNSPNFVGIQFYRGPVGTPFASCVANGTEIFGAPNATLTRTDTVSAGTYDYFVTALNASGAASTPAGPATATVT